MKAPYERLYCVRTRYRVVRCYLRAGFGVLRLLSVVLSKYSRRFPQRGNVAFARLAVFHLVFFLFLFGISVNPTKAFADTYIGGPYKNANDAGLTYLGYDYDALETEFEHTALNELVATPDKYPDYTFWVDSFYEQFDPLNLNPGYYWSKYDGMQFVDLTDRARADVVKAVKAADAYNNPETFDGWYKVKMLALCSPYSGGENTTRPVYDSPEITINHATGIGSITGGSQSGTVSYSTLDEFYLYVDPFTYNYIKTNGFGICCYCKSWDSLYAITSTGYFGFEPSGFDNNYIVRNLADTSTTNRTIDSNTTRFYRVDGKICCFFTGATMGRSYNLAVNGTNSSPVRPFWQTFENSELPDPAPEPEPDIPAIPPETPSAPELPEPVLPTEPDVPENPDLSDLLTALDEHCQHIQLAIYNGLDDYYTSITKYYEDVVKWLADTYKYYDNELDKRFQVLFNYLRSTNQYLKNIDDNVQEILDKLDGLGEQIGIEDIPDSYDANANNATQGSGVLANAYNNVRTKFPFSVIDNIVSLATKLKHDPVAPVISFPIGNPFGDEPYMVNMDFTDWSSLAQVVRTGEIVAAYLGLSRSAIKQWTGEGDE